MTSIPWSFTKTYHHDPYPAIDPTRPELSAKGKVVVVTGASRGIGLAIAKAFAQADAADVVITGRSQHSLDSAKSQIEQAGKSRVHTFVTDVAEPDSVDKAFSDVGKNIGPVDITVSNAGTTKVSMIRETTVDTFWGILETNTKGAFNVIKAFMKVANKNPVLIGTSSGLAHYEPLGFGPQAGYAASKAAMAKLYEYLQAEQPDMRVFTIQPGVIATEMATEVDPSPSKEIFPDAVELPAHFAVWLSSGEADFLKGKFIWANWDVDELKAKKEEILANRDLLTITLGGWGY